MADQNPSTGQRIPEKAPPAPVAPETPELPPYPEVQAGVRRLDDAAEHVPQTPDLEKMLDLESLKPPEAQVEGLALLQSELINLLVKIRKVNPKIDLSKIKPAELLQVAMTQGVKIDPDENMAWQKYMELTARPGLTSSYLAKAWKGEGGITAQALDATDGWGEKLKRSFREHPVRTTLYAAAGVAAVYLGWQLIKKLWSSEEKEEEEEEEGKDKKKKKGGFLGFLQSHGKTMGPLAIIAAGLFLGRDGLRRLLMDMSREELDELMQRGEALPAKVREEIEQQRREIEALRERVDRGTEAAQQKKKAVVEQARDIIQDDALQKSVALAAISEALLGIYTVDKTRFPEALKNDISFALNLISSMPLPDVLQAHTRNKTKGEVRGNELGIESDNPQALFHACALVAKTWEHHHKLHPDRTPQGLTVQELFLNLGRDPSYSIHHAFAAQMSELNLTSVTDLQNNLDRLFGGDMIEGVFEEQRDHYLESLVGWLGVEISATEKAVLLGILTHMVVGHVNLKWSPQQFQQWLARSPLRPSPSVQQAALALFQKLQTDIRDRLLPKVIERYDITRSDKPDYDRLLAKHLHFDQLSFKDGVQLAVLGHGLRFDEPTSHEAVGQAKDVAMVILLSRILKRVNSEAQAKYVGNLGEIMIEAPTSINFNVNLEPLKPYLQLMAKGATHYAKHRVARMAAIAGALGRPTDDPEFLKKMEESDWTTFGTAFLKEGAVGSFAIPKELFLTLYDNFKEVINPETDGSLLLKAIVAMGGVIFYSQGDNGEHLGCIYLMGKYYFWKPFDIAKDAFSSAVHSGLFSSAPYKTYMVGAAPFMVIGGVVGAARGGSGIGIISRGIGFMRGAMRGAAAPVSLPVAGYRALRDTKRFGERMLNLARYGRGSTASLNKSAKLLIHYNDMAPTTSSSLWNKWDVWKDQRWEQTKRLLYRDVYEAYRWQWAKRFIRDYNGFFGFNPERVGSSGLFEGLQLKTGETLSEIVKHARRMQVLLAELMKIPNLQNFTEAELIRHLERINGMQHESVALLEDYELKSLKKSLTEKGGLQRFRRKLVQIQTEVEGGTGPYDRPVKVSAAPEAGPQSLEGSYRYKGQEFKLSQSEIEAFARSQTAGDMEKAIEMLCEKKWNTPELIPAKGPGVTLRYRGGTFHFAELTADDVMSKGPAEMARLCEVKFLESVRVMDIKPFKGGGHRFKIGGEWVETAEADATLEQVKQQYLEELKRAGKPVDHPGLAQRGMLRYFPVISKIVGHSMAALMIYHLETSEDKRKAVAETAFSLGTFFAGMKGADWSLGKRMPNSPAGMALRGVIGIMGGFATALGLHETVEQIVEDFLPRFTGDQQLSSEAISLFEKAAERSMVRTSAASLERGVLRKGLEKAGMKAFGDVMARRVESTVLKRVAEYASKPVLKKLITSLGIRGATLGALLLDDASVIGVLDDVVAAGMAVWMAKDIYDVVKIASKALKIKTLMAERTSVPIERVEFADEISRKAMEAHLAVAGKTLEAMKPEELITMINELPDVRVRLFRQGKPGHEEYRFVKGQVWSTRLVGIGPQGDVELTDNDLNQTIVTPPPKEFRTFEIDPNAPKDKLMADYRLALLYLKDQTGWSRLDYDIVDENTIQLKRLDGSGSLTLYRTGATWSVEHYRAELNLFQAATLGNLVNRVKGLFAKEGEEGASDHPFTLDGNDIDFNRAWNPIDLRVLSGDTEWSQFYQKIGLKPQDIVDTLNAWYSTRNARKSPREQNPEEAPPARLAAYSTDTSFRSRL